MIHGLDTSFLVAMEVTGHPQYAAAQACLLPPRQQNDRFALTPLVLAEFIHIVTDPRRFPSRLAMPAALLRAQQLWLATKVERIYPVAATVDHFLTWMRQYGLGRKRVLDTLLSATYFVAGIASVPTLNRADFETFGCFQVLTP
jgi:predicted nucleic acid-binding protein